jgi:hypothetical protein
VNTKPKRHWWEHHNNLAPWPLYTMLEITADKIRDNLEDDKTLSVERRQRIETLAREMNALKEEMYDEIAAHDWRADMPKKD